MNSITLITSVINTPNKPLSYTKNRSIYNKNERFEQTKNTISSVRSKIPNTRIFLIECSPLDENKREFFKKNVDYFLNIYETNDEKIIQNVYSQSKSLGEGTLTIYALKYLIENNIQFDNLFKISGRYWLNDKFVFNNFDNNKNVIKKINNDTNNLITSLYKINKNYISLWLEFLFNSMNEMFNCIGAEVLFAKFINTIDNNDKIFLEKIGISGNIAVCGTLIEE
jgi:hypothetical protein